MTYIRNKYSSAKHWHIYSERGTTLTACGTTIWRPFVTADVRPVPNDWLCAKCQDAARCDA